MAGEKYIGESIITLKTEGFRGGFLNPFSYKVIVESQDKITQAKPYKAVFILKDADDAKAFLNEVAKSRGLRIWLVGEERAVAKAIETLGKNPYMGKQDRELVGKIARMREYADNSAIRKAAKEAGVGGILTERVKEAKGYQNKVEKALKEI